MSNPKIDVLFAEYASEHRHPTNQLTHKIAIPLIVFHVVAMLDWVHLAPIEWLPGGSLTLAVVAWIAAAAWYLWADAVSGAVVSLFMLACIPLGRLLPGPVVVAIAVAAWLIQLAGHVVWEKKQPSFFHNLTHALIGPLFFASIVTRRYVPGRQARTA